MVGKYSGIAQAIIILAEAVRSLKDSDKDTTATLASIKEEFTQALTGKANTAHTHELSEVVGLIDTLASKADKNHTHPISDIENLQSELDSKINSAQLDEKLAGHQVDLSDYAKKTELSGKADRTELANKADKTQLTTLATLEQVKALIAEAELDDLTLEQVQTEILRLVADKAATSAVNEANRVQDEAIATKADKNHTHAISDITGLQDTLDGKANSTHTHTWSRITGVPNASTTTAGIVQLYDELDSDDDTKALTAKQGKALREDFVALVKHIDQLPQNFYMQGDVNGWGEKHGREFILETTLDSQLFANSMTANGYQKLPNGLIIQWVRLNKAIYSFNGTYNFPIAFPNACFGAMCGLQWCISSAGNGHLIRAGVISNSQFNIAEDAFSSAARGNTAQVFVLAIGY